MSVIIDMSPIIQLMIDISDNGQRQELLNAIFNFLIYENDRDNPHGLHSSHDIMDSIIQAYGIPYSTLDYFINQINLIIYNFTAIVRPIYLYSKRLRENVYILRIENETCSITI